MQLTSAGMLAWRMRRQFLDRPEGTSATLIVGRLCGIQAQVASCAEQAVAARQPRPERGAVDEAVSKRQIVKTWAMRGTLHLLDANDAADYLSLLAAARTWEKPSWQRTFATATQVSAIAAAAQEALAGRVLTRERLTAEVVRHTGDASIVGELGSGWGAVLKPLAWQGYLINGPSEGGRVTFTSPATWLDGWKGLPEPDEAATRVIPAYLAAFGPASMDAFDQWLIRGLSKRASLRRWFTTLVDAGELADVEVDGEPAYARAADVDDMAASKPNAEVRLLPGFDQYVLGPGTRAAQIVDASRRSRISKSAGWISPVVLVGGRVGGTWQATATSLDVVLFHEAGRVPRPAIDAEAERIGSFLGRRLHVSVSTD